MDFSEAERLGFTSAFIEFWTLRGDRHPHEELSVAGESLLRGCEEHFRAGVTCVARINGAVPSDLKDAFTGGLQKSACQACMERAKHAERARSLIFCC
jgi:hypothetical protein